MAVIELISAFEGYLCKIKLSGRYTSELMTNKMKIFGLFICTQSALHVLGDVFAHHQEHVTVFTASAAGSNIGGHYQKL